MKQNVTFDELGLSHKITKACHNLGFEHPSEIQAQAIPVLLQGRDVIGLAQTGTGKTAAFGLPMLEGIANAHHAKHSTSSYSQSGQKVQASGLVLCPTRELAVQTANAIGTYAASAKMHDFNIVAIYGGAAFVPQKKAIEQGVDVIVATPGRLIDMIERKIVDLASIRITVLDEADEMLKMGFAEDVEKILANASSPNMQTCLFSATMPKAVEALSRKFQKDAVRIQAQTVASTNVNISQHFAVVPFSKKTEATRRFIIDAHAKASVVFVRTRATATSVAEELTNVGIAAVTISGDVPQPERERIVQGMRKGKIKVLVATDVAARGLDIEAIELVVNYDLPRENDAYVHRIGRTGRAGRKGAAISLVNPREKGKLRSIEELIGATIEPTEVPTLEHIATRQAKTFLNTARERMEKGNLSKYVHSVEKFLQQLESEDELIKQVAAIVALAVHDKGELNEGDVDFSDSFDGKKRKDRGSYSDRGRGDRPKKKSYKNGGRESRKESYSRERTEDGGKRSSKRKPDRAGAKPSGKSPGKKAAGKKASKGGKFSKKDKRGSKRSR
jgi:ATP-dependent RNA helicase DeaD